MNYLSNNFIRQCVFTFCLVLSHTLLAQPTTLLPPGWYGKRLSSKDVEQLHLQGTTPVATTFALGDYTYQEGQRGELLIRNNRTQQFVFQRVLGSPSITGFQAISDAEVIVHIAGGSAYLIRQGSPGFIVNEHVPAHAAGLSGKHIALWPSHGLFFDRNQDRWDWQRSRHFTTSEGISVMGYVQPYLVPMLERAGAYVMMPRERDLHDYAYVLDNDQRGDVDYHWVKFRNRKTKQGFAHQAVYDDEHSPFTLGTFAQASVEGMIKPRFTYEARIDSSDHYAIYISYGKVADAVKARYTVYHAGGESSFIVDQSKGGGLFHYLGTFRLEAGKKRDVLKITLADRSVKKGTLTTDGVRIGGGTGNVAVHGLTSRRPRYVEGARYHMFYQGMPASVYSTTRFDNDYQDDYKGRGLWVNHLLEQGVKIDAVLAFHTDAGVTSDDRIIGTLAIASTKKGSLQGVMSDEASLKLAASVKKQIVKDVRTLCTPQWTERLLWDKPYFEAWMPEAPTVLLELLSHQNLADARYGLDPRFRFIVSRAIYKAMGRYVTSERGEKFVVQPLAPSAFAMHHVGGKTISLTWAPTIDPIEPSAVPKSYLVYERALHEDWKLVAQVSTPQVRVQLPRYKQRYDYKVVALNMGGESMDSEILSAYFADKKSHPALIVNAFTRIGAPAIIDRDGMAGVAAWIDEGVPDRYDLAYMGDQHEFDRKKPWVVNDNSGWGASDTDLYGKVIMGNTFDFPLRHGRIMERVELSYISMSRLAFEQSSLVATDYRLLDIIFGEQRQLGNFELDREGHGAIFSPELMRKMKLFKDAQVPMLISGAFLAHDLLQSNQKEAQAFMKKEFGLAPVVGNASRSGAFFPSHHYEQQVAAGVFNTEWSSQYYRVESASALRGITKNMNTLFRYEDNQMPAGLYDGTNGRKIVLGFPFETILDEALQVNILRLLVE